jgi:hypothetical protein
MDAVEGYHLAVVLDVKSQGAEQFVGLLGDEPGKVRRVIHTRDADHREAPLSSVEVVKPRRSGSPRGRMFMQTRMDCREAQLPVITTPRAGGPRQPTAHPLEEIVRRVGAVEQRLAS